MLIVVTTALVLEAAPTLVVVELKLVAVIVKVVGSITSKVVMIFLVVAIQLYS